jgi:hypothetical protein
MRLQYKTIAFIIFNCLLIIYKFRTSYVVRRRHLLHLNCSILWIHPWDTSHMWLVDWLWHPKTFPLHQSLCKLLWCEVIQLLLKRRSKTIFQVIARIMHSLAASRITVIRNTSRLRTFLKRAVPLVATSWLGPSQTKQIYLLILR